MRLYIIDCSETNVSSSTSNLLTKQFAVVRLLCELLFPGSKVNLKSTLFLLCKTDLRKNVVKMVINHEEIRDTW